MAKHKKSRKSKKSASAKEPGKTLTHVTFGGKRKRCYGKSVKAGRGNKRVPRVFCATVK
jgi:hypothetical protein